jgi:heme exporter protein A
VPAIEADGLDFSFGAVQVLRGLVLRVESGTATAVFGLNGAGKTTLLKTLAGLLKPDAGTLRIEGVEPSQDPTGFRRLIGVISHQPYVYPQLTGRENLEFYGRLYALKDPKTEAGRTLEEMGLSEVADRAASAYSRGMLQRLAIGRALLHSPPVLLLDEPFTGLDQQAREKLEAVLGALQDGRRTVLMTSHDIDAGLRLADRVAVLAGGRIVLQTPTAGLDPSGFLARYRELTTAGHPPSTKAATT